MSAAPPITASVFVVHGLRAWLSLNDVPWLPTMRVGSYSSRGGINHRLVDGTNEVQFRLETCTEWARELGLATTEVENWFHVAFHRASLTGEPELIAEYALPKAWERLSEDDKTFPFAGTFTFNPGGSVPRATYLDAATVTTPCEGTPDLLDAVRDIHAVHTTLDRDRMIELCEPKVQDFAIAFPNSGEASVSAQLAQLDDVLADKPVFADLEESLLHFEARAGGRVVHVTRADGGPVINGKGAQMDYQTDLLLTRTPAGWRIM